MHRNDLEMSEMVTARQADVARSRQRTTVRPPMRPRQASSRFRRAVGHRFVAIGTALVGPL